MLAALGFVWTAVYVAHFFRPRAARAHAALMTAALGTSLLVARAPTDVRVWVTLSAMIWVAIAILTRLNARLRAEAQTDGLTGLLNRTGFASPPRASARSRAPRHAGRPRGDRPRRVQARQRPRRPRRGRSPARRARLGLDRLAAPGGLVARFGGDEFVLLLPGVDEDRWTRVLARLRRAHPAPWTAGAIVCSAAESLDEAIARADPRLYAAKQPRRVAAERKQHAIAVAALQPGGA